MKAYGSPYSKYREETSGRINGPICTSMFFFFFRGTLHKGLVWSTSGKWGHEFNHLGLFFEFLPDSIFFLIWILGEETLFESRHPKKETSNDSLSIGKTMSELHEKSIETTTIDKDVESKSTVTSMLDMLRKKNAQVALVAAPFFSTARPKQLD